MTTITVEAEAIAALSIPAERLIQTLTDNGPEWHLLNAKRQVNGRLVEQLQERRAVVAAADGLLPEAAHSQTFALATELISVTSQKMEGQEDAEFSVTSQKLVSEPPKRNPRGRPRLANPPSDAERQARSRARRDRRDLEKLVLIAAMDAQLPPDVRARLEGMPRFRPVLEEARQLARSLPLAAATAASAK